MPDDLRKSETRIKMFKCPPVWTPAEKSGYTYFISGGKHETDALIYVRPRNGKKILPDALVRNVNLAKIERLESDLVGSQNQASEGADAIGVRNVNDKFYQMSEEPTRATTDGADTIGDWGAKTATLAKNRETLEPDDKGSQNQASEGVEHAAAVQKVNDKLDQLLLEGPKWAATDGVDKILNWGAKTAHLAKNRERPKPGGTGSQNQASEGVERAAAAQKLNDKLDRPLLEEKKWTATGADMIGDWGAKTASSPKNREPLEPDGAGSQNLASEGAERAIAAQIVNDKLEQPLTEELKWAATFGADTIDDWGTETDTLAKIQGRLEPDDKGSQNQESEGAERATAAQKLNDKLDQLLLKGPKWAATDGVDAIGHWGAKTALLAKNRKRPEPDGTGSPNQASGGAERATAAQKLNDKLDQPLLEEKKWATTDGADTIGEWGAKTASLAKNRERLEPDGTGSQNPASEGMEHATAAQKVNDKLEQLLLEDPKWAATDGADTTGNWGAITASLAENRKRLGPDGTGSQNQASEGAERATATQKLNDKLDQLLLEEPKRTVTDGADTLGDWGTKTALLAENRERLEPDGTGSQNQASEGAEHVTTAQKLNDKLDRLLLEKSKWAATYGADTISSWGARTAPLTRNVEKLESDDMGSKNQASEGGEHVTAAQKLNDKSDQLLLKEPKWAMADGTDTIGNWSAKSAPLTKNLEKLDPNDTRSHPIQASEVAEHATAAQQLNGVLDQLLLVEPKRGTTSDADTIDNWGAKTAPLTKNVEIVESDDMRSQNRASEGRERVKATQKLSDKLDELFLVEPNGVTTGSADTMDVWGAKAPPSTENSSSNWRQHSRDIFSIVRTAFSNIFSDFSASLKNCSKFSRKSENVCE